MTANEFKIQSGVSVDDHGGGERSAIIIAAAAVMRTTNPRMWLQRMREAEAADVGIGKYEGTLYWYTRRDLIHCQMKHYSFSNFTREMNIKVP